MQTTQPTIAGNYILNYARLEFKPLNPSKEPGKKVYSLRIGTTNRSLLFINYTDRTSESTNLYYTPRKDYPELSNVDFTYAGSQYGFSIELENMLISSEKVDVCIELLSKPGSYINNIPF